jgi:hypothetical protein
MACVKHAGPDPMQYFVVMIDYGRRGREAIVDPEVTRREVVARVVSGEYRNVSFIHEIAGSSVEDITADILAEAALPEIEPKEVDLQAARLDHLRDLRKHAAGEEEILSSSDGRLRDWETPSSK